MWIPLVPPVPSYSRRYGRCHSFFVNAVNDTADIDGNDHHSWNGSERDSSPAMYSKGV